MTNLNFEIVTTCPFCGNDHYVTVDFEDFLAWSEEGELVQAAFPYLSADDRELLKTGICPKCWDAMFPTEEEEDELAPDYCDDWPDWEEEDAEDWDAEYAPEEEDWEDSQLELGFDPYLGEYTWDC